MRIKEANLTKLEKLSTVLILLILFSSFSSAFGVSSSYWKGRPLEVYPGQETTVKLALQNMVGVEDVKVRAAVTIGSEIASIDESEYLLRAGTKDTEVPVKIKIPYNATSDTNYTITVSFSTILSPTGGGVALGTGADTTFEVLVTASPPKPAISETKNLTTILIISIGIIILIIVIVAVLKKKKKKR